MENADTIVPNFMGEYPIKTYYLQGKRLIRGNYTSFMARKSVSIVHIYLDVVLNLEDGVEESYQAFQSSKG